MSTFVEEPDTVTRPAEVDSSSSWTTPYPGEWMNRGACRNAPTDLFFPEASGITEQAKRAKAVCARCPVRAECREYAMAHKEIQGVWGGTSLYERRLLRKAAKEVAA